VQEYAQEIGLVSVKRRSSLKLSPSSIRTAIVLIVVLAIGLFLPGIVYANSNTSNAGDGLFGGLSLTNSGLNPADLDACVGFSDRLKEEFKEIVKLEVLTDSQLAKGSCRIESESGVAEYLIEEEKEALEKTLLQVARKEEAKLIEEDDSAYGKH